MNQQPRCPKCGSPDLFISTPEYIYCALTGCGFRLYPKTLTDSIFAQFFPAAAPVEGQRIINVQLFRSLQRLSLAIEDCARIGFQESSPTTNAAHADVWNFLNEAQKDAKLKLKHFAQPVPQTQKEGVNINTANTPVGFKAESVISAATPSPPEGEERLPLTNSYTSKDFVEACKAQGITLGQPSPPQAAPLGARKFLVSQGMWNDEQGQWHYKNGSIVTFGLPLILEMFANQQAAALREQLREAQASNWGNRRRADSAEGQLERSKAEVSRLEKELAQWPKWGVVEVAIRNPQVAEYCEHWEGRVKAAESRAEQAEKIANELRDQLNRANKIVSEEKELKDITSQILTNLGVKNTLDGLVNERAEQLQAQLEQIRLAIKSSPDSGEVALAIAVILDPPAPKEQK